MEDKLPMLGKSLGRYRIVQKLGEGGMGRVYLAHDDRLSRDVAIKVLPAGSLTDEAARKRFREEACALSQLSHPNIAMLHDFDTHDEIDFLVMEYVSGSTLSHLIEYGILPEKEIVRLALQIAEGCRAAHDAGIVHCDLKPANIMVSSNGLVKILDFGLARLTLPLLNTETSESATQTRKGGGTLPYMAPEQLSGEPIDPRTDIYALGNLIYEMATGHRPFEGSVSLSPESDIRFRLPLPPRQVRPEISSRLEDLVLKCLEKDPENRYQTAKEVLVDLRRSSSSSDPVLPPRDTADRGVRTDRRGRKFRFARAAALLCIAAVAGYFLWHVITDMPDLPEYDIVQITRAGTTVRQPSLLPDGNRIAYTSNTSGNADIYVVDIQGGDPTRLTTDSADDTDPCWYPDGSAIAFTSDREGSRSIWKLDPLSHGVRPLVPNAEQPSLSPDGKFIAFCRSTTSGSLRIWMAPIDAPSDAIALTGDSDGLWDHFYPAWSRDGTSICYGNIQGLWRVPASGSGKTRQLTHEGFATEPRWSPDDRFIYFSSYMRGVTPALWRIRAGGGKPQRVTTGTAAENHPDISKSGQLLCYSSGEASHKSFLLDRKSGKITDLWALDRDFMAAIAPDGSRIVFPSERGGPGKKLWMAQLPGSVLTTDAPYPFTHQAGIASHPSYSPDGNWIAYYQVNGNTRRITIISPRGGQPSSITDGLTADTDPAWSHDNTKIAFVSDNKGKQRIGIARVSEGKMMGTPQWIEIKDLLPSWPAWSPDGGKIAFLGSQKGHVELSGESDLWIVAADGNGQPQQITRGANGKCIRWDRSTGNILLSASFDQKRISLCRVSPDGSMTQQYQPPVEFGDRDAYGIFDISGDGRFLVFSRTMNPTGPIGVLKAVKGLF